MNKDKKFSKEEIQDIGKKVQEALINSGDISDALCQRNHFNKYKKMAVIKKYIKTIKKGECFFCNGENEGLIVTKFFVKVANNRSLSAESEQKICHVCYNQMFRHEEFKWKAYSDLIREVEAS